MSGHCQTGTVGETTRVGDTDLESSETGVLHVKDGTATITLNGKDYVVEVRPSDVLFGRGSGPNDHEGNIRFRTYVFERKAKYMATNHRLTKTKIARDIVNLVFNENGRFLRKVEYIECKSLGILSLIQESLSSIATTSSTFSVADEDEICAYEIQDDDTIMEKAKQALRQNATKFREEHMSTLLKMQQQKKSIIQPMSQPTSDTRIVSPSADTNCFGSDYNNVNPSDFRMLSNATLFTNVVGDQNNVVGNDGVGMQSYFGNQAFTTGYMESLEPSPLSSTYDAGLDLGNIVDSSYGKHSSVTLLESSQDGSYGVQSGDGSYVATTLPYNMPQQPSHSVNTVAQISHSSQTVSHGLGLQRQQQQTLSSEIQSDRVEATYPDNQRGNNISRNSQINRIEAAYAGVSKSRNPSSIATSRDTASIHPMYSQIVHPDPIREVPELVESSHDNDDCMLAYVRNAQAIQSNFQPDSKREDGYDSQGQRLQYPRSHQHSNTNDAAHASYDGFRSSLKIEDLIKEKYYNMRKSSSAAQNGDAVSGLVDSLQGMSTSESTTVGDGGTSKMMGSTETMGTIDYLSTISATSLGNMESLMENSIFSSALSGIASSSNAMDMSAFNFGASVGTHGGGSDVLREIVKGENDETCAASGYDLFCNQVTQEIAAELKKQQQAK